MIRSVRSTSRIGLVLTGAVVALTMAAPAQTGGGYDLSWSSIDSGTAVATGVDYTLMGVAGQPDAGPTASGGGYTLIGGLLQPSNDPPTRVHEWALY